MATKAGQKIPVAWALDADGNPTDDPGAGLKGMLLAIGGYKGYGLAVVMDVLNALMTGSHFGMHWGDQFDPTRHENTGHFFMALQISRFVPLGEFKQRADQMTREIRGARRAQGADRIYLPGEIEWERKKERLIRGIPLAAGVVASMREQAANVGASIDV